MLNNIGGLQCAKGAGQAEQVNSLKQACLATGILAFKDIESLSRGEGDRGQVPLRLAEPCALRDDPVRREPADLHPRPEDLCI